MGAPPASQGSARTTGRAAIERWTRRCLANWRSIVATVLVVAAVGVAAGVVLHSVPAGSAGRATRRHTGQSRRLQTAPWRCCRTPPTTWTVISPTAKSHLTGNFLAYYSKFTEQIVAPAAQQKHCTTTAQVVRAAISELHPDSAVVLVFVNQTTTSKEKPEPQKTASSALVTLTKVNGSWLISKLDPLGVTACGIFGSNRYLVGGAGVILIARERRNRCRKLAEALSDYCASRST